MLAEDGAGRLSARLPHPAGPQAAFPRDPRGGSVTVPAAGIHTHRHTHLFLHMHSVWRMLESDSVIFTLVEGCFILGYLAVFVLLDYQPLVLSFMMYNGQ